MGKRTRKGFVLIYRKVMDSKVMRDPLTFWLFTRLIMEANWRDAHPEEDQPFSWNGEPRFLRRGQIFQSITKWAKSLKMDRKVLERRLARLKKAGCITFESGCHGHIITICNYNKYQDPENKLGQQEYQLDPQETKTRPHKNNINNNKKGDFEKNCFRKKGKENGSGMELSGDQKPTAFQPPPPNRTIGTEFNLGLRAVVASIRPETVMRITPYDPKIAMKSAENFQRQASQIPSFARRAIKELWEGKSIAWTQKIGESTGWSFGD